MTFGEYLAKADAFALSAAHEQAQLQPEPAAKSQQPSLAGSESESQKLLHESKKTS
jgi:hypothetical protein